MMRRLLACFFSILLSASLPAEAALSVTQLQGFNVSSQGFGVPLLPAYKQLELVGYGSAAGSTSAGTISVNLTTLTGGSSSTAAAGDLVIVFVNKTDVADLAMALSTSGYTTLTEQYQNDTRDSNFATFWKIMGPSPDTSVAYTASGNNAGYSMIVYVIRNADQGVPISPIGPTTAGGINSSAIDPPALANTTLYRAGYWNIFGGGSTVDDATGVSNSAGAMENQIGTAVTGAAGGGSIAVSGIGKRLFPGYTGDFGAWSGITTSTSDSWNGAWIPVQPAVDTSGVQIVGTVTGERATAGDITLSLTSLQGGIATAAAQNDLVLVWTVSSSTTDQDTTTSTSGFTEVADLYGNGSTNDANSSLYYKLMTSSPDTSVTVNSGSGTNFVAGAVVYRNVNTASPFDATTTTATNTTSNPDPASITTVTNNALVVVMAANAATGDTSRWATTPSGGNQLGVVSHYTGGSTLSPLAIAHLWRATAGAYNPPALSATSSNNGSTAVTVALRPGP